MTNADALGIRVISRLEYVFVFQYLGETYATDGIEYELPRDFAARGVINGDFARILRGAVSSAPTSDSGFIELPDGNYALTSKKQPLAIGYIPRGIVLNNKLRTRKKLLSKVDDGRYLEMVQRQASHFVSKEVATHGIPNINKNIVATCEKGLSRFTENDLATIKNSSNQLRAIVNSHRVLLPDWDPRYAIGAGRQYQDVHRQLRRHEAIVQAELRRKGVLVQLDSCYKKVRMRDDDSDALFSNMYSNAAKYTRPGSTVNVTFSEDDRHDAFLIRFTMESANIEGDEVPLIRRFGYRGRAARAHAKHGKGIGLAITCRVLEGYGGEFDVVPGPPDGVSDGYARNRFYLWIPSDLVTDINL